MTDAEIRVCIAEACGWVWYRHPSANTLQYPHYRFLALPALHEYEQAPQWMVRADGTEKPCAVDYMAREFHIPDYSNDLNACHEMERMLDDGQQDTFLITLRKLVDVGLDDFQRDFNGIHATARQRCEAFLRTIGKWKD